MKETDRAEPVSVEPQSVRLMRDAKRVNFSRASIEEVLLHIDSLRARVEELELDAETGKKWREDSSLETWFPFTAEELARLRARVEELTGAVREWLCDKCNTVYPGPPQKGFWCVQCPKCGGPTGPKYLIVNKHLRAELGAKQAEIDRLMLEYCPNEMTPEQIANWQKHQKPAKEISDEQ